MRLKVNFKENNTRVKVNFKEAYKVSDGGYERGFAEGEKVGYSNGYTEGETKGKEQGYTEGYAKAESVNPFYYATKLDNAMGGAIFPENYEAVIKLQKAPTICTYLFNNCDNLKSVKFISEDKTNVVNFACSLQIANSTPTLELVDFTEFNKKFSSLQMSFRNQTKLKRILGTIDASECIASSAFASTFTSCSALEDIEFVPNTIKISIECHWCTKLSKASITSIINGLSADTSGNTVTLSKTAVNNAFGGTESDEWLALVATKPNWTISLS